MTGRQPKPKGRRQVAKASREVEITDKSNGEAETTVIKNEHKEQAINKEETKPVAYVGFHTSVKIPIPQKQYSSLSAGCSLEMPSGTSDEELEATREKIKEKIEKWLIEDLNIGLNRNYNPQYGD